jgi:hypothetical protein
VGLGDKLFDGDKLFNGDKLGVGQYVEMRWWWGVQGGGCLKGEGSVGGGYDDDVVKGAKSVWVWSGGGGAVGWMWVVVGGERGAVQPVWKATGIWDG